MENKPSKIVFHYVRLWEVPSGGAKGEDYRYNLNYFKTNFTYEKLVSLVKNTNLEIGWRKILYQHHKEQDLYEHVAYHISRWIVDKYLKIPYEDLPLLINKGSNSGRYPGLSKSLVSWRLKNDRP